MKAKQLIMIATTAFIALCSLGGFFIANEIVKSRPTEGEVDSIIEAEIADNSLIKIKKAYSGYDGQGNPYQDFDYTIVPNHVKDSSKQLSITFADYRNPSSYLKTAFVSGFRRFRVTCLQAFDSVATLTMSIGSKSTNLTLHYLQKWDVSWDYQSPLYYQYDSSLINYVKSEDNHPSLWEFLNEKCTYTPQLSSTYTKALPSQSGYEPIILYSEGNTVLADYLNTYYLSGGLVEMLFGPAFSNYSMNYTLVHPTPRGLYLPLTNTFATLTSSEKSYISTYVYDGKISFAISLSQVNLNFRWGTSDAYNLHGPSLLFIELDVLPIWGI